MSEHEEESRTLALEVLAHIPRAAGRSLQVTFDEAPDGSKFVSVRRWQLSEKQKQWISPRGIAVYAHELRKVAAALLQGAERIEAAGTKPPDGGETGTQT